MSDFIRKIDTHNAALRIHIEKRLAGEAVSWDYTHVTEHAVAALTARAALTDLMVVSRDPPRHDYVGPTIGFLGELLAHARTPIFIPASDQLLFVPRDPVLVAWDGSVEAANAVRSALALLKMSSEVHLLSVKEHRADDRKVLSTRALLGFLSRHGVLARLRELRAPADDDGPDAISSMIVKEAGDVKAGLIVIGGYSHTRVSEYLFGGVTRNLLEDCPLPVLMAH